MIVILFFVVVLVAWSLHLMQEAVKHREFSLMLAGTLVAASAAAMMLVYFLMHGYMGYVSQMNQNPYWLPDESTEQSASPSVWYSDSSQNSWDARSYFYAEPTQPNY